MRTSNVVNPDIFIKELDLWQEFKILPPRLESIRDFASDHQDLLPGILVDEGLQLLNNATICEDVGLFAESPCHELSIEVNYRPELNSVQLFKAQMNDFCGFVFWEILMGKRYTEILPHGGKRFYLNGLAFEPIESILMWRRAAPHLNPLSTTFEVVYELRYKFMRSQETK